ncbi:MAG: hypothetical protein KTR18_16040 [Acidiferrobacterales bacterium]|nr:hypothetical protein [Acidiferrobacterales bacterium]
MIATGALQNDDLESFKSHFLGFSAGLIAYLEMEEVELYRLLDNYVVELKTSSQFRKIQVALKSVERSSERLLEMGDNLEKWQEEALLHEMRAIDVGLLRYFVALENNIFPLYEDLLKLASIDRC